METANPKKVVWRPAGPEDWKGGSVLHWAHAWPICGQAARVRAGGPLRHCHRGPALSWVWTAKPGTVGTGLLSDSVTWASRDMVSSRPPTKRRPAKLRETCSPAHHFFLIFFIFIFRQTGRERKREENINVWLPLMHRLLGTWSATQACALSGNQTQDPLVFRPALNPLRYTSQGQGRV